MDNNSLLITNQDKKQYIVLLISFILIVIFQKLIIKNIKLFLVILLLILYKYRPTINLIFILFIILSFGVLCQNYMEPFDACINNEKLINLINNIDPNKLYYNYDYDSNYINEMSWNIFLLANKNDNLKDTIKNKMIEIFRVIKLNKSLRNYLIFNNLINNEGYPLYIDFSKEGYGDMLLLNEIKILLITSKIFKK